MKKRLLPILMAILMVFAMMPQEAGTVFAEADPDTTKPVIDLDSLSVILPEGKDKVTVGETVTLSMEVSDDRGISGISLELIRPKTGQNLMVYPDYQGDDAGTQNGLWTATFTVDEGTENGIWRTNQIWAYDTTGNACGYYDSDMNPGTGPAADLSNLSFEVYGTSSDPDITKPVIDLDSLSVTIPDGKEKATIGDTVTLSMEVSDDRGISGISLELIKPKTGFNQMLYLDYQGDDAGTQNGLWASTFTVDDGTENGIWRTNQIWAYDTTGNACGYYDSDMNPGTGPATDLSSLSFEVTAPDCPLDLTTPGYSMMLDGGGATTEFGGNYYVNELRDTVKPTVNVRFDADDGTWTTLAPRKYTLKYEKKTGENRWEDYTADTFGVDENGTAAYRVSATGKESLYYTGTVGPVEFNVIKKCKVTFDTRGGSEIAPQYVIPGEKVTEPEVPTKDDYTFDGWFADEALTEPYDFDTTVNEDITLYAKWKEKSYADITPPEIDLSTLKAEISSGAETATVGDTVTVSVRITDDRAVRRASIIFNRPTGGIFNYDMAFNAESGCYEYVMPITESTVPGEYTINQISAWDSSDNSVNLHYSSADFSAGSFIVSGTTSDETPPAIDIGSLQLTLPESMEFAVTGDSVKVRVSVSDEGLGVSQVTIQYRKPVSGDDECIRLTYNSETEKWENEIRCDKTSERGTWKIYSIEALDRGGNLTRIINSEFDSDSGVDLSAGDFQLRNTVTFDTRGGSNIDPQYVMLGEKATRPADPTKGNGAWQGGGDFAGWYADEAFTQYFNFNTPITEDTTIYARWAYGFSICSYDKTNSADYDGGKYMVLQHGMTESDLYYGGSNFTLYEGEALTLKAVPDPGYKFAGWYKGEYIGMVDYYHTQVSRPLDMSDPENLLSSDLEYSFVLDQNTIICPVFEVCEEHQWDGGTVTKKATCTGTGTKTFKCTACGTEKTEELPALGHKWTGPAWSWDGYIKATATFTCSRCQAKEKVTGKSDGGVITKKPTATATGIRTYTVSVKGIDGKTYTTTKTETLAKTATELKETHVTAGNQVYNGTARKPAVVKVGTKTLTEGTDYTATYQNNQNVGTATVTITGKGNYTGTVTKTFAITQASLKNATVSGLAAKTYNGTAQKPAPTVKVNLDGKTFTLKSSTDYTVTYKNNTNVGTATVTITGKGNFKDAVSKTFPIKAADIKATTVTGLKDQSFDGKAKTPAPTLKITLNGKTVTLKKGTDYAVRYKNNTDPGQATVTITGKGNFTGTKSVTFKIVKQKGAMERLAGADRYATSLAIADQFKKEAGVSRFKALIMADGINYPDALAGSYLGLVKDCPVVSVAGMYPNHQGTVNAIAYIKRNLVAGGQIYIVGGEGSVDPAIEKTLKAAGYKVKRLAGNNRYLTNLEILKEAKIKAGSQFIVCTGAEFADALSASATGKPLLLVAGTGKALTAEQKAYLQSAKPSQFFVVGDAKVVSNEIINELKTFAPVTRVGSGDAYSRSLAVTRKFFTGNQMVIQVADGRNFPDGLCGGALAARRKAPLLLSNDEAAAVFNKITDFAKSANAIKLTVFGGTGSVSDKTAKTVIGLN